jgi:hypothetical protein
MSNETKLRTIGAKKAPQPLTMSALVNFAERVIRTDKEAALRAQNSVADLATPSNDQRIAPRISGLKELCTKTGSVKIKSNAADDDQDDEDTDKLISFGQSQQGT